MLPKDFYEETTRRPLDEALAIRSFLRHLLSFYNFPDSVFKKLDNPSPILDPNLPINLDAHEKKIKQLVEYMLSGVKKERQDEFLMKVMNQFERIKHRASSLATQKGLPRPGSTEYEDVMRDFTLANLGINLHEYCDIHLC